MALLRIRCRIWKHRDMAPENKSSHLYIFDKENWLETIRKESLSSIVPPQKVLPKIIYWTSCEHFFWLGSLFFWEEKPRLKSISHSKTLALNIGHHHRCSGFTAASCTTGTRGSAGHEAGSGHEASTYGGWKDCQLSHPWDPLKDILIVKHRFLGTVDYKTCRNHMVIKRYIYIYLAKL